VPSLIWSPRALRVPARLHGFLVAKDRAAARRAVQAIREGVKLLAAHPRIGRPVEGMDAEFREWPIPFGGSGYLALYRVDGPHVVILAVRHGKELAAG
jgi:plasmid stabilization system protein ParE